MFRWDPAYEELYQRVTQKFSALVLALQALGLHRSSELFTPSFAWAAAGVVMALAASSVEAPAKTAREYHEVIIGDQSPSSSQRRPGHARCARAGKEAIGSLQRKRDRHRFITASP
ncbi:hypothetical protein KCMC57_up00550 [Kitasatospora sp. CMC57]|uniref:Uncharacterized protein n=1 Tax=Kitasatospora sp. CMC57 TaxID=3231513 RepID=A0AB33JLH6_9ACTN